MIDNLNKKNGKTVTAASSSMKIDLYGKYGLFIILFHGSFNNILISDNMLVEKVLILTGLHILCLFWLRCQG